MLGGLDSPRPETRSLRSLLVSRLNSTLRGAAFVAVAILPLPIFADALPAGFRPLFNGADLTGWRGMGTDNPYDLAAKSEADRAAFFAANQPALVNAG
jgi:hypothetical protein